MKSSKKEESAYRIIDGIVKGRASAIWYTNLDISKRHENLGLIEKYTPEKYPKYDNYDVIEVAKVVDIPCIMMALWRPISFMDKFIILTNLKSLVALIIQGYMVLII